MTDKETSWYKKFFAIDASIQESVSSQLPGRENGPADSYRHLLWSGELTRRFGEWVARGILEGHEFQGSSERMTTGEIQSPEAEAMDRHNNEIGIAIGKDSKSWSDVIARSQQVMDQSDRSGDGRNHGARWLPQPEWRKHPINSRTKEPDPWNWPQTDWEKKQVREEYNYSYGGDKKDGAGSPGAQRSHPDTMEDQTHAQKMGTSEKDIRKLMSSDAYLKNWHPYHDAVHQVVEQYFKDVYGGNVGSGDQTGDAPLPGRGGKGQGGMVHVRSYLRDNGQVPVRDHDRSSPSR